METAQNIRSVLQPSAIEAFYGSVRQSSRRLCESLSDADATVQSMPDASPAKWHLAHTSWFFETMVLGPHLPGYRVFDNSFNFLFNSYYETIGARHPRPKRGMITRPSLEVISTYRAHVDAGVGRLLDRTPSTGVVELLELGCHHEQQHQELLLTDILHLFSQIRCNPHIRTPQPAGLKRTLRSGSDTKPSQVEWWKSGTAARASGSTVKDPVIAFSWNRSGWLIDW